MKKTLFIAAVLTLVLALSLPVLASPWSAPGFAPPNCPGGTAACNPPINVSATAQVKAGSLGISSAAADDADLRNGVLGLMLRNPSTAVNSAGIWSRKFGAGAALVGEGVLDVTGIQGINDSATGISIMAQQDSTGFGFYQFGATAKNYFQGNVGVGTANPSSKLTVAITDPSTVYQNANTQIGLRLINTSNTNNNWNVINFNSANNAVAASVGAQYVNNASNWGDLVFGTRGAGGWGERMRVDSSGNVGIGTNAPATKLDVNGNVQALGFKIAAGAGVGKVLTSDATGLGTWRPSPTGGGGVSKIIAGDNITISPSTGIGDVTVNSSGSGTNYWTIEGAHLKNNQGTYLRTDNAYLFTETGNDSGLVHGGDGNIRLQTDGATRLTVTSNGRVGIGTINPGAELEVAGQVKITGGIPGAGKILTSDASGLANWASDVSARNIQATGPICSSMSGTNVCLGIGSGGTAGVSQIIAGPGIDISPDGGTGAVTIGLTGGPAPSPVPTDTSPPGTLCGEAVYSTVLSLHMLLLPTIQPTAPYVTSALCKGFLPAPPLIIDPGGAPVGCPPGYNLVGGLTAAWATTGYGYTYHCAKQ